jgi:hypothetical protein
MSARSLRASLACCFAVVLALGGCASSGTPDDPGDASTSPDAGLDTGKPTPKPDASDGGVVDPDLAEAPELTAVSPQSAKVGGVGPSIIVTGKKFVARTVVQLDGAVLATTYISPTELRATIPTGKLLATGQLRISVGTAPPGGGASQSLLFDVVNPTPILTAISNPSPPSVLLGSPDTPITVTGADFAAGAKVSFDGVELTTTFKADSTLDAVVPAAKLVKSGTYNVVVKNPAPGGGVSSPIVFTVTNPTVMLTSISPNNAEINSAATSITLGGTGFLPVSSVSFNGVKLATVNYVSATQLTAVVPPTSLSTVGDFPVVVTNPAPGGGVSMPQLFQVRYPAPSIASLTPQTAITGAAPTMVTVTGSGFFPVSQITFNNAASATTYVSSTQLRATLTAAQLAVAGSIAVRVVNPMPGGGTSLPVNFDVNNPTPSIATVVPSKPIYVGSSDTVITINGAGFLPASQARANGSNLLTTFVSGSQLTATVPGTAFSSPGTVAINVFNAAPGGGTSNTVNLTVGCDPTGVEVALSTLNAPVTLQTNFKVATSPKQSRFANAGACPMSVDTLTSQPYRAVVVQNTSGAAATVASWAVCTLVRDGLGNPVSGSDALLTFYRGAKIPATNFEREVCSPVVSEGYNGAGAYDSPEANESGWCPGLTKGNGGGLSLGVCEKAVVFMQPYDAASTVLTPPLTMKVSLQ